MRNPRDGDCEATTGVVDVVIQGGISDFLIEWSGAVNDDIQIEGRWFTIRELAVVRVCILKFNFRKLNLFNS
jgi:hypothetical protein